MSRITTIVIPLTVVHPMQDEDFFQDGWSIDVVVDMDFMRKVRPLLDEAAEYLKGERDSGDPKHPLELVESMRCGPGSYRAELKYDGSNWVIPLEHRRLTWNGGTEFWGHSARKSVALEQLFRLTKAAEECPEWALVNPYTVRCDDTLVTTLADMAAYNGKKTVTLGGNSYQRTLYHQIDQAGSLGWVPTGMQHLYGHNDAGSPVPAPQLAEILALSRLEGKENWAMYKVLRRLYDKLGGK